MQWRVDQANYYRVAFAGFGIHHSLKDAFEVAALEGEQLVKSFLSLFLALCQDHLLYDGQAFLLHEHMLGATETDALGTKGHGTFGVARIVGIGPHAKPAVLIGPAEQLLQLGLFLIIGFYRFDDARENFACRTIDRDVVSFTQYEI